MQYSLLFVVLNHADLCAHCISVQFLCLLAVLYTYTTQPWLAQISFGTAKIIFSLFYVCVCTTRALKNSPKSERAVMTPSVT